MSKLLSTERKVKFISSPNISGELGSFSLEKPFSFENCRERFAGNFQPDTLGFYFNCENSFQVDNVSAFINRTEKILHQPISEYSHCNRSHILYIEPIIFWKESAIKRSLLTILLRCGINYSVEDDNYEEALFGHEYVKRTEKAVKRFLCGYTQCSVPIPETGSVILRGWVKVFENVTLSGLREMLVWPEDRPKMYIPYEVERDFWN